MSLMNENNRRNFLKSVVADFTRGVWKSAKPLAAVS